MQSTRTMRQVVCHHHEPCQVANDDFHIPLANQRVKESMALPPLAKGCRTVSLILGTSYWVVKPRVILSCW